MLNEPQHFMYCRECTLGAPSPTRRRDSGQISIAGRPNAGEIMKEIRASVRNPPVDSSIK
jgi:hypothetical protein